MRMYFKMGRVCERHFSLDSLSWGVFLNKTHLSSLFLMTDKVRVHGGFRWARTLSVIKTAFFEYMNACFTHRFTVIKTVTNLSLLLLLA